jgi:hypothetical protein
VETIFFLENVDPQTGMPVKSRTKNGYLRFKVGGKSKEILEEKGHVIIKGHKILISNHEQYLAGNMYRQ